MDSSTVVPDHSKSVEKDYNIDITHYMFVGLGSVGLGSVGLGSVGLESVGFGSVGVG
jgi:hypothetical protein